MPGNGGCRGRFAALSRALYVSSVVYALQFLTLVFLVLCGPLLPPVLFVPPVPPFWFSPLPLFPAARADQMALQIDDDVTSQNAFLDTAVAGRMDSTAGALGGALNQLRLLTDDSRGGFRKSTLLVAGGVGAMTVLYLLLRMLF